MKNIGGSAYPRGRSRTAALSDSVPALHAPPRVTRTIIAPWAPEYKDSADAVPRLIAELRPALKASLDSDAAAVHAQLQWEQLQAFTLRRDFGGRFNGLTLWLRTNRVVLAGLSASSDVASSLYDALSHALFGPDCRHGPKLRWLAVQHMSLNRGAFLADARDAGRSIEDFLRAHQGLREPGTRATLRALASCLGVTVRVMFYSTSGSVTFVQYEPEGAGAADAPRHVVHLFAPTIAGDGLNNTVMYDVMEALPPPPAPGSKRVAAAAELPTAAAPAKVAAGAAPVAPEPLAAADEDVEQAADSDAENEDDEAKAIAARLARETGAELESLDSRAWAAHIARSDAFAVHALIDGVRAMCDHYNKEQHGLAAALGRKRNEALQAVDAAVTDAEKAVVKAQEEAFALAGAHTVLVVGEEGAGKSSLVNRILLRLLASPATLARINAGASDRADKDGLIVTSTCWDEERGSKLPTSWFSDAAEARAAKLYKPAETLAAEAKNEACPTGGDMTTTAMCTTVVLAPGLQPRLVLKYKNAAALREVRRHVDEVRDFNWGGEPDSSDSSDDDDEDSAGAPRKAATSQPSQRTATAGLPQCDSDPAQAPAGERDDGPEEPEDSSYWADYATAVYGVDPLKRLDDDANGYGAEVHVLRVHTLTDDELAIPPRFRCLLGTTQTLRLTQTNPTDLIRTVTSLLTRHTLGRWSHWGLLESVRLYMPSEGATLTLVDVPGYSDSLLPYRKETQDWAFNTCRFSSLVHCVAPRFQNKTIPPQMLKNTKFKAKVLCPLADAGASVDFRIIPLYCIDHGISKAKGFSSYDIAVARTQLQAKCGDYAVNEDWKVGLRKYLEDTMPEGTRPKKLAAKLAVMMESGVMQPKVVNCTPTLFDEVLHTFGGNLPADATELTKWNHSFAELVEMLTHNSVAYSQRVAARVLESLIAHAVVPLLRHLEQLEGFRNLEKEAPQVLETLRLKITPQYRESLTKSLREHLHNKFEENEAGHVKVMRMVLHAATRLLRDGCQKWSVITQRFWQQEFESYHKKHSRQLKPDIKSLRPHSVSAGLLKRLLFGTECDRAVNLIAAGGAEELKKQLFFEAKPATGLRGTRALSTVNAMSDLLCHMLRRQLQEPGKQPDAKLTSLVTCTEELICDDLAAVLSRRRDKVVKALSNAALTHKLELADDGILARAMLNMLQTVDTTKLQTNKKRVDAMATAMASSTSDEVAKELHAHVLSVLDQLEGKFTKDVVKTCDKLMVKLQTLDKNGLRALANANAFDRSSCLGNQLSHLTAGVMDACNVGSWLGNSPADRLRLTADLQRSVRAACVSTPRAADAPPAGAAASPAGAAAAGAARECPRCRSSDYGRGSFLVPDTRGENCLVCFKCFRKTAEKPRPRS